MAAPPQSQDTTPSAIPGRTLARAVMATSGSQLIAILAAFLGSVAQARLLGADGRGDVTRFANASGLAVLYFGFGINSAITYFVASKAIEPKDLARLLRRVFVVATLLVVLSCTLAVATPARRFLPAELPETGVIAAIGLFFAFSQLSGWFSALLSARANFTPINVATVTVNLVGGIGSSVLLWLHPEWAGVAAIIVLIVVLEGIRAAILALLYTSAEPSAQTTSPSHSVNARFSLLARYSFLSYAGEAVQFLTYRFDMWVVDASHGPADLGRYSLAVSLAQLTWIVPTAAAQVLFPYSTMIAGPEGALLAWRTARIALLVCAAAAALGMGLAHLFLTPLFGQEFEQVPSLIGILLLGIVPYSLAKVLGHYLAGVNALSAMVLSGVLCLAITICLDLALIPTYGTFGAAWATAISYAIYALLILGLFMRRSGFSLALLASLPFRLNGANRSQQSD